MVPAHLLKVILQPLLKDWAPESFMAVLPSNNTFLITTNLLVLLPLLPLFCSLRRRVAAVLWLLGLFFPSRICERDATIAHRVAIACPPALFQLLLLWQQSFLPRAEFGFAILCAFTVALKPTLSFLNADQFALYSAPHSLFFDFLQCLNRVLILDAGGAIIGEDVA